MKPLWINETERYPNYEIDRHSLSRRILLEDSEREEILATLKAYDKVQKRLRELYRQSTIG
jgi:hypothetical protein